MTTEQPPSSPADLSPQRHVQYPENPTHNAGLDGFGGASDVDSVVMRRTYLASGTPRTRFSYDGAKRWYVLQNWRQDAAVIISDAGVQRERAFYSPYGRVFGMPAGDLNFDGEFTSAEATTISGWSAGYRAYADINLDGVIDGDDATANTPGTLGWDALSRDDSTIGYAGYVQDSSIPTLSHVRHRVYKSDLGRWVQRDPAGYVDGANLYEYVRSSPVTFVDWSGLASQRGSGCGLGGVGVDACGTERGIQPRTGSSGIITQFQHSAPPPPHYCELTTTNFVDCKSCCRRRGHDAAGTLRCIGLCRVRYPPLPLPPQNNWCTGYPDSGKYYYFADCCEAHDNCYFACLSKGYCDLVFCQCVANSCNVYVPGSPARRECDKHAGRVCAGVIALGWIGYDKSCKPGR